MNLIFITGGVRSGKSAFAERLATQYGEHKSNYYVATGIAFDEEMKARIKRHQNDRQAQSLNWITIEVKDEFPEEIKKLTHSDVLLFECVTTWLSNLLYYAQGKKDAEDYVVKQIARFQQQLQRWQAQGVTIIIVSNEVLDEPRSKFDEVNVYRKLLGELHQWLVARSEEAYEVQFQLVQRWK